MSALAKPADEPEDTATPIEAAMAEEAADDDLTESPAAASPDAVEDLRAALVAALDARAGAEEALEGLRAKITLADERAETVRAKLAAATEAVAAAKAAHADALGAALDGGAKPDMGAVRAAKFAETDIGDELDAIELAVSRLRNELGEYQENIKRHDATIICARNAVLAPHVAAVLERTRRAKAVWTEGKQVLRVLIESDRLPDFADYLEAGQWADAAREPLVEVEAEVNEFLSETVFLGGPAIEAWRVWRRALAKNPDLPPPPFAD